MLHTKSNKISPKNRGNSTFIPQIYSRLTGKTTTAIGVEKKKKKSNERVFIQSATSTLDNTRALISRRPIAIA